MARMPLRFVVPEVLFINSKTVSKEAFLVIFENERLRHLHNTIIDPDGEFEPTGFFEAGLGSSGASTLEYEDYVSNLGTRELAKHFTGLSVEGIVSDVQDNWDGYCDRIGMKRSDLVDQDLLDQVHDWSYAKLVIYNRAYSSGFTSHNVVLYAAEEDPISKYAGVESK